MKITALDQLPAAAVSHNPSIKKRVMMGRDDLPHLTNFSQACFAPGQVAPGHSHPDMAEVFLVESGQGTITVNGQPYPLSPGTCVPSRQETVSPLETIAMQPSSKAAAEAGAPAGPQVLG